MATGHILPGYGNPVTRLKRSQSAYPMDSKKLVEVTARELPGLERRTLDAIRQNARSMWLSRNNEPTTYNSTHHYLKLDEPTQARPTSPSRFHKPHPKNVFLINRLHYVPGYHNPDATMGKDVYRVDDTYPEVERQLRRHQREKYVASPTNAALDQYQEQPYAALTDACGPVEAWGAQAWLKTADDDKKHEVMNAIQDYREKELFAVSKDVPNYAKLQTISRQFTKPTVNVQTIHHHHENPSTPSNQQHPTTPSNQATTGGATMTSTQDNAVHEAWQAYKDEQKQEKAIKQTVNIFRPCDQERTNADVKVKETCGIVNTDKSHTGINNKPKVRIQSAGPTTTGHITTGHSKTGHSKTGHSKTGHTKTVTSNHKNGLKPTKSCLKERNFRSVSCMTDRQSAEDVASQTIGQEFYGQSPVPQPYDTSPRPHTAVPSMHRWMKKAGATESEQVRRILYGGYPPSTIQPLGSLGHPNTTYKRRQQDVENVQSHRYIHHPKRGDFLIHPEWPPTFYHHRID